MKSRRCAAALAAAALLLLAACGGGGGGSPTTSEPPAEEKPLPEPPDESIPEPDPEPETEPEPQPEPDPDPPLLPELEPIAVGFINKVGGYILTGTEQYDEYSFDHIGQFSGTRNTWSFNGWGLWGTVDGATVFRASISGINIPNGISTALLDPYYTSVFGLRSFDNPVGSGRAVWRGDVRAYETHPDTFGTPIEGDARLEMDLDSLLDTINVRFTNFERGHFDMSWYSVFVSGGGFRSFSPGDLEGNFYGDDHEGVAGTFDNDGLKGIFGAVRE